MTYFIIPENTYNNTNWSASEYCNVGPVEIYYGQYAGSYAVNTNIFKSDSCFEKYRSLLNSCEIAELSSELKTGDVE